jgi:uncharacterized protein (DUF2147 family)
MLHRPRNIMRQTVFSVIVLAAGSAPAMAIDPTGDWRVADGVANIRVAQCNGSMWGVVAWEKEPGGRDTNNPDPAKQKRPTLGMSILIDMKKKAGADQWEGQVYNAKDGKLYDSTITPSGSDKLEIQGCVLGFLCGGETWTRVGPPIPSSPVNSMAKGAPKTTSGAAAPAANAAPAKTTGAAVSNPATVKTVASTPKAPGAGQKAGQPADAVGDICLLPDIARFTH